MSRPPQFPGATTNASRLRILAIAGSLRENSLNRRLVEAAAGLAAPGMEVVVYRDLERIPLFNEDLETAAADGPVPVRALRTMVRSMDGLLLATPEYNQSFPGVLKNTLDWLSRGGAGSVLWGKPAAVVGATPGPWGTRLAQSALRQVLAASGSLVLPTSPVFVRGGAAVLGAGGSLSDEATRTALETLLGDLAEWIRRVSPGSPGGNAGKAGLVGAA